MKLCIIIVGHVGRHSMAWRVHGCADGVWLSKHRNADGDQTGKYLVISFGAGGNAGKCNKTLG